VVKVVGLMGSPRSGGNTDILLDAALEGAREAGGEAEKVVIGKLDLRACRECDSCMETGECVVSDGMVKVYDLLRSLDVLIVASPIFFSSVTAQTKTLIDRCQCIWARKYLLNAPIGGGRRRVGAFLAVGGRQRAGFEHAAAVVRTFFLSADIEYAGELTFPGIDEKGAILGHPTALREAKELGRRLVSILSAGDGSPERP